MWNTGIGLWHLVQDIESKVFIKIKRVTALSFLEKWQYSTQTWRIEQSHIRYAHGKSISSNNFIKHLTGLIIVGVFFLFEKKKKTPNRKTVRCPLANKSLNKKKKKTKTKSSKKKKNQSLELQFLRFFVKHKYYLFIYFLLKMWTTSIRACLVMLF